MSKQSGAPYADSRSRKGFTLIEISVVVVIIAVLAALAVPAYQRSVERSRAVEASTVLNKIRSEQEKKAAFGGGYADKFSQLSPVIQGKKSTTSLIDTTNYKYELKSLNGIAYAEATPKSKYEYTVRTGAYSSTNLCAEGKDAGIVKSLFKGCDSICDDIAKTACTSTGGSYDGSSCKCTCPPGTELTRTGCVKALECDKSAKPAASCGNCGTRSVSCNTLTGKWETGSCSNEGQCSPNSKDTTSVANGTKTCSSSCKWGEVVCDSGYELKDGKCEASAKKCDDKVKPDTSCGNCGTRKIECDSSSGKWTEGSCTGEGECAADDTKTVENGSQTCSSSCKWGAVECDSGYSLEGGKCVKEDSDECGEGFQEVDGECVCIPTSDPAVDEIWSADICAFEKRCPSIDLLCASAPGAIIDYENCECNCPANYYLMNDGETGNGKCGSYCSYTTCPAGQVVTDGNKVYSYGESAVDICCGPEPKYGYRDAYYPAVTSGCGGSNGTTNSVYICDHPGNSSISYSSNYSTTEKTPCSMRNSGNCWADGGWYYSYTGQSGEPNCVAPGGSYPSCNEVAEQYGISDTDLVGLCNKVKTDGYKCSFNAPSYTCSTITKRACTMSGSGGSCIGDSDYANFVGYANTVTQARVVECYLEK
ncbi:prepilin-type N-terminal cleavage/methylation domain-containing protein [Parelusimicrobium proximum]|uniref:prepilin-type N-terminal cleavage/methylation domain-containing protein n=1 Tax=Parelusimicrobium proximum TaxID=3228953 RepID=UPI003D180F45